MSHNEGSDAGSDAGEAASVCERMGGRCQSPDLLCGEGFVYGGLDSCGDVDNYACCLPDPRGADAGAPPPDAGPAPSDAGPTPSDAGPRPVLPGTTDRIVCGMSDCDATTQGCLASCLYATDERMPACVALDEERRWPADDCPTGREEFPRYWLTCDGAEDCAAGEICHLVRGSLGQYTYCDACEPPCDVRSFDPLCRSDADCPAELPRCLPTDELPGYSTCVGDGG